MNNKNGEDDDDVKCCSNSEDNSHNNCFLMAAFFVLENLLLNTHRKMGALCIDAVRLLVCLFICSCCFYCLVAASAM